MQLLPGSAAERRISAAVTALGTRRTAAAILSGVWEFAAVVEAETGFRLQSMAVPWQVRDAMFARLERDLMLPPQAIDHHGPLTLNGIHVVEEP